MLEMFRGTAVILAAWTGAGPIVGQCVSQLPYINGTATIAGTLVTASGFGDHSDNTDCGPPSGPYLCGGFSGSGGFNFTFDPPVDSLTLDFSALHFMSGSEEVMRLFVNGAHYAIPQASTQVNSCLNVLAELTPEGDVRGVDGQNCGWKGTTVPGPIAALTVLDSIATGQPAGAFCSIYICPAASTGAASPLPAPPGPPRTLIASADVPVRISSPVPARGLLTDLHGRPLRAGWQMGAHVQHTVPTLGLPGGHYLIQVITGTDVRTCRLVLVD